MTFPTFKTADEVPEAFRSEYEEKDGEWKPKENEEARKDRQRRARLLDEKKEEERRRIEAEKERDDLKRELEGKKSGATDEVLERLRKEDADKRAKELTPVATERDQLKIENRKLKRDDKLSALAIKHGIMGDRLEDAMLALEKRVDLSEGGDSFIVKDKEGQVTTETVDDFLSKTFKAEKLWLYGGSGASGSGAGGSDSSSSANPSAAKTAEEAADKFQAQREARPNPLAPKTAGK